MSENQTQVRLGHTVPDFALEVFDPTRGDFDTIRSASLKADGKWTILFFYPADFTFV